MPSRTFLVRFGGHGSYFGETQSSQNTHGEAKRAWYAAEAYQKGTMRYLPNPNFQPKI